jgi:hypothetical protein
VEAAIEEAGADQPLVLGSVSSPKLDGVDGEDAEDAGPLTGTPLRGSGVLQAAQTAVPGGLVNPQCGHSVADGMMNDPLRSTIHEIGRVSNGSSANPDSELLSSSA